jgi:tetratricopeptide (TPR) repeat protein
LTDDDIKNISNTEYTNDEGWQQIINDLEYAYNHLPVTQAQKGRPTKAAAAAFLAKVYLYKAYRQDDANSNQVTSINEDDLKKVIEYTTLGLYQQAGCELESDLHNNFRPEEIYENGKESIWAIQYSKDDGTFYGNLNFSNRLIPPELEGIMGGCDFYKPSKNLVNAYVTDMDGHPTFTTSEDVYEIGSSKTVDPRLFITVGMPGTQFMFNPDPKFKIEANRGWSRSGGNYGYYISLKQCVDPDLTGKYLFNADNQWASSMNRIVFRYADVLLMRAEAYAQLGKTEDAIKLVNQVRSRAKSMQSSSVVAKYSSTLNVHYNVKTYDGSYDKAETMKIVKMERRLELAMESERFFDLVRWGEAEKVINDFYLNEKKSMKFIEGAHFTANKNEYLPIPHEQMAASNGKYTQNCGNW